jgi:hypothetical protein
MFYFDPIYFLFALPALVISGIATLLLRYWYGKYSRQKNSKNLTGKDVAREVARDRNIDLKYSESRGNLSDHYNPFSNELSLSYEVANNPSVASVAIAAHEMGHADQDFSGSVIMKFREVLVPGLNIGTNIGYLLIVLGFLFGVANLVLVGIILFSGTTFFTLFTLPIEIDASRRAINMIRKNNFLTGSEISGAKKVLAGAALTYVAAVLSSLGTLIYYIFRYAGMRRRRD